MLNDSTQESSIIVSSCLNFVDILHVIVVNLNAMHDREGVPLVIFFLWLIYSFIHSCLFTYIYFA